MEIPENKIQIFIRIARRIAINLPNEKDRIKASKWIKKIESANEKSAKRTKIHALQLLLICLQRNSLVGPFENLPEEGKKLQHHNWAYQPNDIAKYTLQYEFNKIGTPPVTIEISGDLNEFVSYQEIPSFGAHFFYAYSPEELRKWDNLDKSIVPRGYLNLTLLSSPDTSTLAQEENRSFTKKKKIDSKLEKHQHDFHDITIIDENAGDLKEAFVDRLPIAKEAVKTDLLKNAMDAGIVRREDIGIDAEIAKEAAQTERAHVEEITVTKDGKRCIKKKKVKKSGKDAQKIEDRIKELEEKREAEKNFAMEKMPARLRERLSKKYTRPASERPITTPEIFKRTADGKYVRLKRKRIYKPEEFGLTKDEKFIPAEKFVKGLKYKEPEVKIRRSPVPRDMQQFYRRSTPIGSWGSGRRPLIEQEKDQEDEESPTSKKVRLSWERSWEKLKSAQQPTQMESSFQLSPKRRIRKRLEAIKSAQPRQLVFDESFEVDVTPEEISFERFVYQELPDESEAADESVDLLKEDDMQTEDIFGEQAIADVSVLPKSVPIDVVDQAEFLLEQEMETDDLFAADDIADPKVVFKEIAVEGERYDPIDGSVTPDQRNIRIGRRMLGVNGGRPTVETFREPLHAAERDESVLSKIMDIKQKALGYGQSPPKRYGPWAAKFQRQVERLERGETSIESAESDILGEDEMKWDDEFEPGTPEIVQERRRERLDAQSARLQELKRRWMDHVAQSKAAPPPLESDMDLLDPLIFHQPIYEPKQILDLSNDEDLSGLPPPLVKPLNIRRKNIIEEFEEQIDRSLSLLYGSEEMPSYKEDRRAVYDPDFLERTIHDVGTDNSILSESEMEDSFFGEPMDKLPIFKQKITKASAPKKKSVRFVLPPRPIEERLPLEQLDETSIPEDELAMAATLLESEPSVSTEMVEPPESPTAKRMREEYLRQSEKIQELKRRFLKQKEKKKKPIVLGKKGMKIYRGPLGSPGIPGMPGPSGLSRVQWESPKRTPSPASREKQRLLELDFEKEIDRQMGLVYYDRIPLPAQIIDDQSYLPDTEERLEDISDDVLSGIDAIEVSPVKRRTDEKAYPRNLERLRKIQQLRRARMPRRRTRLSPIKEVPEDKYERFPTIPIDQRVPAEIIDDQSFPSEFLDDTEERLEDISDDVLSGIDAMEVSPVRRRIDEEAYLRNLERLRQIQQLRRARVPRRRIGLPPIKEVSEFIEQRVPEEEILDDISSGLLSDIEAIEGYSGPEEITLARDETPSVLAKSIQQTKKLQDFKRRYRQMRGLPPSPEEQIKNAVQDYHDRQRIIENMGLMDQGIQETLTERPLIPEPEIIQPLNVIEQYERDMAFIEKARRMHRQSKEISSEARRIVEKMEKEAALKQQRDDEIIEDMEDLDLEVAEPPPLSKIPMHPSEIQADLEDVSFPESEISFEDEDRFPVYTREQFDKEFEEQRQRQMLEEAEQRQRQMLEVAEQPPSKLDTTPTRGALDMANADMQADEPDVVQMHKIFKKNLDRLRKIRQLKRALKRRVGLSPIKEVPEERYEDEDEVEIDAERLDDSFKTDPFASFEANIDYYIIKDIGERVDSHAPPLTAEEMISFDEEDVEQPPPVSTIPMPPPIQPMPAEQYFDRMKAAFAPGDNLEEIEQPEEMEALDEFYGITDEYGMPLSPTQIALARNVRQSMVTTDLIRRYEAMRGIPHMPRPINLPHTQEYLKYHERLKGHPGLPQVDVETDLLDESFPGGEYFPTEESSILGEDELNVSFAEAPVKRRIDEETYLRNLERLRQIQQLRRARVPRRRIRLSPIKEVPEDKYERFPTIPIDQRVPAEIIDDQSFPSEFLDDTEERLEDISDDVLSGIDAMEDSPVRRRIDEEAYLRNLERLQQIQQLRRARAPGRRIRLSPIKEVDGEEFPAYESFLEQEYAGERITDQELLYESILDRTPIDDIFNKLNDAAIFGEEDIYSGEYSGFESSLERTPTRKPIEDDFLDPTDFVQYPDERGILDESITPDNLASPLIKPPAPRDYLQFDDSIGSPDKFEDYQIKKQFGIEPGRLPSETLASLSPPFYTETPPRPQQTMQPSPRRVSSPPQMERIQPRPRPPESDVREPSLTLEDRFDILADRGALPRPSIQMSSRERIRQLIARQPRFEMVPVRRDEYAPLEFISRPIPEEKEFLEAEEFPYDHLPYDEEDIEFGDLYHALYIPTEAEEREIQEFQSRRQTSPVQGTPPRFSRMAARSDSPIGKTWISPGEEGFKWLDNYVPSQGFEDPMGNRKKVSRRVTFAPQLQIVKSFDPTLAPSELRIDRGPPRVASLPHPRLSRLPRQTEDSSVRTSTGVLKGAPRVASLRNPRLARQLQPPPTPTTPKTVLKTVPRVASLQNPRLTRLSPPRLSTSRSRLIKPKIPKHYSFAMKQKPRRAGDKIAGSLEPIPVKRPPRPLLPHELPRAAEIIRNAELEKEATTIKIFKTSEPGKETVRTSAEHQESNALPRTIHDYSSMPSTSRQSNRYYTNVPSISNQSGLPTADGKRITQTLTKATVGNDKFVAKRSSLTVEKESADNTRKLTKENVVTTKDPERTKTSVNKLSIKKGSQVGRKPPQGPSKQ